MGALTGTFLSFGGGRSGFTLIVEMLPSPFNGGRGIRVPEDM